MKYLKLIRLSNAEKLMSPVRNIDEMFKLAVCLSTESCEMQVRLGIRILINFEMLFIILITLTVYKYAKYN